MAAMLGSVSVWLPRCLVKGHLHAVAQMQPYPSYVGAADPSAKGCCDPQSTSELEAAPG